MIEALPLPDLLARRLSLQWFEGVAIVREVAGQLLADQGTSACRIPELQHIELRAEGSLALAAGVPVNEPVRRLGQLLQAMLTDADVPVQLRLVVSRATAPTPSYSSLTEFDLALEYFERPDRAELLRALFARAAAAGPANESEVALTLDRIAPLQEAATATVPARKRTRMPRLAVGIIATIAAVAALTTAGALYVRNSDTIVDGGKAAAATAAAADVLGSVVLAGVSTVSDSVGLGRLVAAKEADAAAVLPAVPARERRSGAIVRAVHRRDAGAATVLPLAVVAYDVPEEGAGDVESTSLPADPPERSTDPAIDGVVYAVGAAGVSPPVGLTSQLRRALPAKVNQKDLSRIVLIIAQDGSVESVRLLGDRPDVRSGMFLSAVKAWEFSPAMKEGLAVRYRKTILVSFE